VTAVVWSRSFSVIGAPPSTRIFERRLTIPQETPSLRAGNGSSCSIPDYLSRRPVASQTAHSRVGSLEDRPCLAYEAV
jgi:hypothetical protein